jgi:molybdate transport system substrate-binding protein
LLVVAAAGCASASSSSTGTSALASGAAARCHVRQAEAEDSGTALHGSIRVLAAASLDEAFGALGERFEQQHRGTHVELSFGPSSGLVAQLHQGSPADVIATADTVTMHRAVTAGDVEPPVTFACNRLAILVRKGNPKHVASLADLSHVDFVLCAAPVPCGRLAREALARAGVTAEPIGSEKDVSTVVAKVEQGDVDAGIVYVTDADAARSKAGSVAIPPNDNVVTAYPIAVASQAANRATARAFEAFVTSPEGQRVLARYGFTRS